jgi:hypothetical protein
MHRRRAEEGQVIVIIALSIVVIIGMTALAIDGSRYYADRRSSQAAADSAALAGAGAAAEYIKNYSPGEFYCGSALGAQASTKAILAAINNAAKDDITLSADPGAQSHVDVTCDNDGFRKYLDIHVQVTSATELAFGKILTSQPLVGQVEAVTRVYPQENLAFGNAIASLSPNCTDGGIYLDGGSEITIYDGGVFSNSCLEGKGNISLVVSDAKIQYLDDFTTTGAAYFSPAPVKAAETLPAIDIDSPDCSSLAHKSAITTSANITPGIYPKIALNAGSVLNMAPGLYCLDGDFKINGNATINGTNVTIYMRSGGIDLTGTSSINLSAPNCTTSLCGVPPAIRGILFFVDPSNTNPVKFAGTATSSFMGTIYAPSSEIVVTGTSDVVTIQTQMIGQMVSVTGNVKIELNLDGAELYQMPSSIELRK